MQSSYNSRTVAPRTMNYKHPLIELLYMMCLWNERVLYKREVAGPKKNGDRN